ncbi:hypothetical protein PsYK624_151870 [Phanerochaete sordida]|uniref:Uncharacterized protein n=1 Tax=Phanerochaete sordida TaxID=48140 RepID=A0A9P3LLQ6_9APHY|nr:hypothetical protein PsYK624_151870 [Phanerochaete sordida]
MPRGLEGYCALHIHQAKRRSLGTASGIPSFSDAKLLLRTPAKVALTFRAKNPRRIGKHTHTHDRVPPRTLASADSPAAPLRPREPLRALIAGLEAVERVCERVHKAPDSQRTPYLSVWQRPPGAPRSTRFPPSPHLARTPSARSAHSFTSPLTMTPPALAKTVARRESRKSTTGPRPSRSDYPSADALSSPLTTTLPVFAKPLARREARKSTNGPRPSSGVPDFDFDAATLVDEPLRGTSGYGAVPPVLAGQYARKIAQRR